MAKKEEIINELNGLPESSLERLLDFIRYLKMDFSFKDLMMRVNGRGIQNLMGHIDSSTLALVLKNMPEELIEKFSTAISKKKWDSIREEIVFMGLTRTSDIEKARRSIIDMVRHLEDKGELIIGDWKIIV